MYIFRLTGICLNFFTKPADVHIHGPYISGILITPYNVQKILTAVNGQEALDIVRQLRPQVVLLDIQMPILNGLEVLKEIKADPNLKDIAVIMVSAYTSSEDIEQSMNLGASGFIKKPVIMDILLSTVTAELDKI